jgi:hypothetical protein
MKAHVILGMIATLLLLGCDSPSTSSSTTSSSSQGPSATSESTIGPVAEVAQGVAFEVTPHTLRECDPPAEVNVSWDTSAAGIAAVKIFIAGDDGQERLFAFLGGQGTQKTGPWIKPKDTFILKDESEAHQLAKFVIGSEKCG